MREPNRFPGSPGPARLLGIALALWLLASQASAQNFVAGLADHDFFPHRDGYSGAIPFTARGRQPITAELELKGGDIVHIQEFEKHWNDEPRSLLIEGVPIGGPYTLRFMQGGASQQFEQILVGEIWVVSGQDNALGTPDRHPDRKIVPQVHAVRDGRWQPAEEPVFDVMRQRTPPDRRIVTPWTVAANRYYAETGMPVGLVCWGYPGVSIRAFLDPQEKEAPRLRQWIETFGKGAHRFFWFQGASDANLADSLAYRRRLESLVGAVRRYTGNPETSAFIIQTGRYERPDGEPTPYFGKIRGAQKDFVDADPNALLLPTMHLQLADAYRLSSTAVETLGENIARLLTRKAFGKEHYWKAGPAIKSIRIANSTRRRVLVEFEEAAGKVKLGLDPEQFWRFNDDTHLGWPDTLTPVIEGESIQLEVHGARFSSAQARDAGAAVQLTLTDSGYIGISRIAEAGPQTLGLDLDRPLGKNPRVSYCLMDADTGSIRDGNGHFLPAFADREVEPLSGIDSKREVPRTVPRPD